MDELPPPEFQVSKMAQAALDTISEHDLACHFSQADLDLLRTVASGVAFDVEAYCQVLDQVVNLVANLALVTGAATKH